MLKRRHVQLNSGYNCLMCANPLEETIDHMIFQCPFSMACCQEIPMTWDANGDRLSIISKGEMSWNKSLFMEIFMIASWNIWKERNKLLFEGVAPTISSWKTRVKPDLLLLVHRKKSDLHPIITHIIADL
jgi:hypothetical protein